MAAKPKTAAPAAQSGVETADNPQSQNPTKQPAVRLRKTTDYTPDIANANTGTERGLRALDDSLSQYGAGRSIVSDKYDRIIGGNKTLERAVDLGILEVIEVETDGNQLVVVKRKDLDLNNDPKARGLAYADNRVAELDLTWNIEQLLADIQGGLTLPQSLFNENELNNFLHTMEPFEPENEWQGMPEFDQEDLTAAYSIRVNFKSFEDLQAFSELIDQKLTESTRSIWYPPAEIGRYADKRYADES